MALGATISGSSSANEIPSWTRSSSDFEFARNGRRDRYRWQLSVRVRHAKLMETNTASRVLALIEKETGIVATESDTLNELVTDSLEKISLVQSFEEEFKRELSDEEIEKLFTVADLIACAESH